MSRPHHSKASVTRHAAPRNRRHLSGIRDITARKEAETKLLQRVGARQQTTQRFRFHRLARFEGTALQAQMVANCLQITSCCLKIVGRARGFIGSAKAQEVERDDSSPSAG
jgi:hypothetical protein